jgi:hypothetical protein
MADPSTSTLPNLVSEPYAETWVKYQWLIVSIGAVWAGTYFEWGWYWIVGVILLSLLVASALAKQATIEYAAGRVCERSLFFGRWGIGSRRFPISHFHGIVYELRQSDGENRTVVGLRHRSGRKIWIRSFSTDGIGRGRPAEEFAWRLSCDTDIEIDEQTG